VQQVKAQLAGPRHRGRDGVRIPGMHAWHTD
jgi:hypothetical protein